MITPKIFSHPNTIARGEMTPLNVTLRQDDNFTGEHLVSLACFLQFLFLVNATLFDYFPICFGLFNLIYLIFLLL
jgi:hypothetical protein